MNRYDPRGMKYTFSLIKDVWGILRDKEIASFSERLNRIVIHCSDNPSGLIGVALLALFSVIMLPQMFNSIIEIVKNKM